MSTLMQNQANDLFVNLDDADAHLIIELMKRMLASDTQSDKSGVKIGLGKGKINYPENFQEWDDQIVEMFEENS